MDPCHHLEDCFLNKGRDFCFRASNLGTFQTSNTLAGTVVDSNDENTAFFDQQANGMTIITLEKRVSVGALLTTLLGKRVLVRVSVKVVAAAKEKLEVDVRGE